MKRKKSSPQQVSGLEANIQNSLLSLVKAQDDIQVAIQAMQFEIDKVLTPATRKEIKAIQARYGQIVSQLSSSIKTNEDFVKAEVLRFGSTVRVPRATALYQRGKFVWDGKKLMELAQTDYRLLKFRKQGQPSARITYGK